MLPLVFLLAAIDPSALVRQIAGIASESRGHTGASILLIETGERASFHGTDRFPMQSVYKFPIAMAVLHRVDSGAVTLDQSVAIAAREMVPPSLHSPIRDRYPDGATLPLREILRYAVSESDGTASDVLLRLAGGAPAVTSYLESLGIHGVRVVTTEMAMSKSERVQYQNWAQPDEMVALLAVFHQGRGLSAKSRDLLREWMTVTTTGLKRLRGMMPEAAEVAHKTGTSNTFSGLTRATNDVGVVTLPDGRHLAIAVFVSDSRAPLDVREGVIAKIARAAWDGAVNASAH